MMHRFAFAAALVLAAPLNAQDPETEHIVLETTMGDIVVALETGRAPITAENFLRYVDEGRFDGTAFYRVMKLDWGEQPNGLVQGGPQMHPDRVLAPIVHEPTSQTGVLHTRGALSMARFEPGSATGDFSIMMQDIPSMDANPQSAEPEFQAGYAAFGHVLLGMEVVEAIYHAPIDAEKGAGFMRGQMIAEPVEILLARRITDAEIADREANMAAPLPALEDQDQGDLADLLDAATAGVQDAAAQ